jgi:hypothetical protein
MPRDKGSKPLRKTPTTLDRPEIEVVEDERERRQALELLEREKHLAVPFEKVLAKYGHVLADVDD